MRNLGIAWILALGSAAGCGKGGSGGGKDEPSFEGGKNSTDSATKFTSFAVAAAEDLPPCNTEIEGSLAYLNSEKKFRVCTGGNWTDVEIKGEAGKDGATGPKGQDGVTKIQATIMCLGNLSTLSDADRTLNGNTVSPNINIQYKSATFSSGDTFATANVIYPLLQVSSSNFYSASQQGAATASVLVSSDAIADSTFGFWEVSVNRSTGVAKVRYTDFDFGQEPNYLEWEFQPSACTIKNY